MVYCALLFIPKDIKSRSILFPTAPCVGDLIMLDVNGNGETKFYIVKKRVFDINRGISLELDYAF